MPLCPLVLIPKTRPGLRLCHLTFALFLGGGAQSVFCINAWMPDFKMDKVRKETGKGWLSFLILPRTRGQASLPAPNLGTNHYPTPEVLTVLKNSETAQLKGWNKFKINSFQGQNKFSSQLQVQDPRHPALKCHLIFYSRAWCSVLSTLDTPFMPSLPEKERERRGDPLGRESSTGESGTRGKRKLGVGSVEGNTGGRSLGRKTPGPREKVEILREQLQHTAHIPGQQVLAADFTHPWEVIDFLQRKPEFMNNGVHGSTHEMPSGDSPKIGGPLGRCQTYTEDRLCPG